MILQIRPYIQYTPAHRPAGDRSEVFVCMYEIYEIYEIIDVTRPETAGARRYLYPGSRILLVFIVCMMACRPPKNHSVGNGRDRGLSRSRALPDVIQKSELKRF